jgi:hypothetical protein
MCGCVCSKYIARSYPVSPRQARIRCVCVRVCGRLAQSDKHTFCEQLQRPDTSHSHHTTTGRLRLRGMSLRAAHTPIDYLAGRACVSEHDNALIDRLLLSLALTRQLSHQNTTGVVRTSAHPAARTSESTL